MDYRTMIKRLLTIAALLVCTPALAQWQVPTNSVPIGRGSGAQGFKFAAPGVSGLPLTSAGASVDPAFGQLGLNGLPTIGSKTILANITGGSATPTAASLTSVLDTVCVTQGAALVRNASAWACVTGTSGQVLTSGGPAANTTFTSVAGTGTVTSVSAGTGMAFTPITTTGAVAIDKATASDVRAATSNKTLTSDIVFNSAGGFVTLSGTSSVTPDFSTGFNFSFTATTATNFTLQNPTNTKTGQMGCILFAQPASGTVASVTFGSNWITPGGVTGINLAQTLGATNTLCYVVLSTGFTQFTMDTRALAH